MSRTQEVSLSTANESVLYETLILLYPQSYRKRFGREIFLVIQDMYQEEIAKYGKMRLGFWLLLLKDIIESLITQHVEAMKKQGMKNYLQKTLHLNKYNLIGGLLLLPFSLLLASDFISRVVQGDFSHPNKSLQGLLSNTILYSNHAHLLWVILILFPVLAISLNIIPFVFSIFASSKKLLFGRLIFSNILALAIAGLGFLCVLIVFWHDAIPCFINRILYRDLGSIGQMIAVCRNA